MMEGALRRLSTYKPPRGEPILNGWMRRGSESGGGGAVREPGLEVRAGAAGGARQPRCEDLDHHDVDGVARVLAARRRPAPPAAGRA